ncbi:MAG: 6-carboxytetrahydropterin synthase [Deltaproteobacteria bacterium]|nr:6-carboxytetrahydropterin synthase [Deltaproteobacteria bacterium]
MRVEIARTFRIEAARRLPHIGPDHPCARVHGHGFTIELVLRGEIDPVTGWLCDYADIERAFAPLAAQLDHALLNDVEGLANPTSEHLARWIHDRAKPSLPALAYVSVCETPVTRATYPIPTRSQA